jgi:hypothetical protein
MTLLTDAHQADSRNVVTLADQYRLLMKGPLSGIAVLPALPLPSSEFSR